MSTCVISNSASTGTFVATDTNHYVPIVNLSIQDNAKLLQQLKSGFKRTINWNRYKSKVKTQASNLYLDYLINLIFQGKEIDFSFYHLKIMPLKEHL